MNTGAPPEREFLNARQYYYLLKQQFATLEGSIGTPPANTPAQANKFLNAYDSSTGIFTLAQPTIGNISGLQTALDLKQPLDGDLTAIAAFGPTNAMIYRSGVDTWGKVFMGSNMSFAGGVLNTINFFTGLGTADDTIASAGSLDLTTIDGPLIDVTGNTTISTIVLQEGREVTLRFTGTPTITAGASVLTPGGEDIIAAIGGFSRVLGEAAGVVRMTFQDANDYSRQTFDNIYMNDGSGIKWNVAASQNVFFVGRQDPAIFPNTIGLAFKANSTSFAILKASQDFVDINAGARLDIDQLTGVAPKLFSFPDLSGTFCLTEGAQTLEDKTIGDVTLSGHLNLTGVITPPALTADVNDYAPTGFANCSVMRLQTDGAGDWTLTGLAGGTDGKFVTIYNVDTLGRVISLSPLNPASAAANQFDQFGQYGIGTIGIGSMAILQYDGTSQLWRTIFLTPPFDGIVYWSNILGDILNQTDLIALLDAKLNLAGGTMTGQLIPRTGGTGAGTAPIKFISGALMSAPVAGAIEFLTDVLYFTKTTGAVRTSVVVGPTAGPITFAGPTAARIITVPNAACTMARTDAANTFTGVQTFNERVRLKGYTVATLPAGTQGDTAFATDLLTPAYLAAAVGGGAIVGPVFYDGTAWVT